MDPHFISNYFGGVLYFTIFLCATIVSAANGPDGFLSIDCGNTEEQYADPQTSLVWENDRSYIQTGNDGNISRPISSHLENHKALSTFRYFRTGLQKYCYELPMPSENSSFLIRAMFLHGNSAILEQRLRFKVYINATSWIQVQYGFGNIYDLNLTRPVIREGMFLNHGRRIFVCLVPEIGTPFISSLELRKVDSEGTIYPNAFIDRSRWANEEFFLSNVIRWNTGWDYDPLVRYPNDVYDRFWESRLDTYINHAGSFSYTSYGVALPETAKLNAFRTSLQYLNNIPYEVMKDAWYVGNEIRISLNNTDPLLTSDSLAYLILYLYSNESGLQFSPVPLSVTLDGNQRFLPITNQIYTISIPYAVHDNSTSIALWCPSDRVLLLTAVEVYRQVRFIPAATISQDLEKMEFLKTTFNLSHWQGDPCIPAPYDGISCRPANVNGRRWRVQSLSLSYLQNSSNLMAAPEFIAFLESLSVTNSNLNDDTVQYLVNNFSSVLNSLNLSHNNITDFFNPTRWKSWAFGDLDVLDLSYNYLSKFPSRKDLDSLRLRTLNKLDISNNNITGELQEYSFRYFIDSLNFESLYVNNNSISGELNLSTWHKELLRSSRSSTNGSEFVFHRLFSFVNNDILNINPSLKDFESTMDTDIFISHFLRFNSGILLGGNPYCRGPKTRFHRFLCRSFIDDDFEIHPRKKINGPLIFGVSIPGGVLMLIGGFIIFFTIWRLRKQVLILKEFQQELLNRNVKPPFFPYQELKAATQDFHNDNCLGKGGFGAVYKGILQNKSEVAVKKLFNKGQQAQVLSDFLNEVVLLTGIKHKNLVQLLGCCINDNERILVYELAERGNIADSLWGTEVEGVIMSWEERLNICLGTARGLSYLHEELQPRIIHRDIKAENVLLDKNFNPKIADFGLAIPLQEEDTRAHFSLLAGTKGYLAPEYVMEGHLTEKADVYSFGILVLEIVSGKKCVDLNRPPDEVSLKSQAERLQRQGKALELLQPELQGECPPSEVTRVINIALLCVSTEPKMRPTMSQVVVMLAGITEDALFVSLSEKRRSFEEMSLQFGAEGLSRSQRNAYHDWTSLIPWQGRPSIIEENTADYSEEEALMFSQEGKSSFFITSSDAGESSTSGTIMGSFHNSISAISRSFRRH